MDCLVKHWKHGDGNLSELINCGERKVQKIGRIALKDIIDRYGIKEGDVIEVFIKKI